jgi:hypothetical protein
MFINYEIMKNIKNIPPIRPLEGDLVIDCRKGGLTSIQMSRYVNAGTYLK